MGCANKLCQCLLQRASGGFRVIGPAHGTDNRNTRCAGHEHLREPVAVNPANHDDRCAHMLFDLTDEAETHTGVLGLCWGWIDGTDREVIRPFPTRSRRLCQAVGRLADDLLRSEEAAGGGNGKVVLPQVNAGGPNRSGDVNPVVDDEGDACGLRHFEETRGFPQQGFGGGLFCSKLDGVSSSTDRLISQPDEVTSSRGSSVDDDVESPRG